MKKKKPEDIKPAQPDADDYPTPEGVAEEETGHVESIEDFIELKRLQNRILGKIIDQIKHSDNPEKSNNK